MPKAKKKNIKVRDLKPKKDAKGGTRNYLGQNASSSSSSYSASQSASNLNAPTRN
jgi:hypothetical protein